MTLLTRLRDQTRPHHEVVERQFGLFERTWSAEQYRALLRRFLGYYDPLEERIAAAADWSRLGFDWPRRRKSPLLRRDLSAAGDLPDAVGGLPRCIDLPSVGGLPQALGSLYVLEGATLGGRSSSVICVACRNWRAGVNSRSSPATATRSARCGESSGSF